MRNARLLHRSVTLTFIGLVFVARFVLRVNCGCRWGGSSTQFSVIIWNAASQDTDDVSVFTSQAADMASLILDYINAIMATTDTS